MPDDVGGRPPFQDGEEPDSHSVYEGSDAAAEDEFAAVILDEEFVHAARIHEPSAVERMVAAAEARVEAEAALAGEPEFDDGLDEDGYGPYGPYGGRLSPYRGHLRWQRPVALILAVVMGVGIVALVFTAVYRSSGSGQDEAPTPGGSSSSSTSAESGVPSAPVAQR
ncbi:hypothetical protein [Streptomyces boninensis]|uniref:SCO2584 family spore wall biosynthesis protein n=1 Tax=Streptomyces boninensis TaxID=2039455 RepID=UPI003B222A57